MNVGQASDRASGSRDRQYGHILVDRRCLEVSNNVGATENLGMGSDFVAEFLPPGISLFLVGQFRGKISQILDAPCRHQSTDSDPDFWIKVLEGQELDLVLVAVGFGQGVQFCWPKGQPSRWWGIIVIDIVIDVVVQVFVVPLAVGLDLDLFVALPLERYTSFQLMRMLLVQQLVLVLMLLEQLRMRRPPFQPDTGSVRSCDDSRVTLDVKILMVSHNGIPSLVQDRLAHFSADGRVQ